MLCWRDVGKSVSSPGSFLISCGFISFTWELLLDWLEEGRHNTVAFAPAHIFFLFWFLIWKKKKVKYNIMLLSLCSLYTQYERGGSWNFRIISSTYRCGRWRAAGGRRRCGRERWASEKEKQLIHSPQRLQSTAVIFWFWFLLGCMYTHTLVVLIFFGFPCSFLIYKISKSLFQ